MEAHIFMRPVATECAQNGTMFNNICRSWKMSQRRCGVPVSHACAGATSWMPVLRPESSNRLRSWAFHSSPLDNGRGQCLHRRLPIFGNRPGVLWRYLILGPALDASWTQRTVERPSSLGAAAPLKISTKGINSLRRVPQRLRPDCHAVGRRLFRYEDPAASHGLGGNTEGFARVGRPRLAAKL